VPFGFFEIVYAKPFRQEQLTRDFCSDAAFQTAGILCVFQGLKGVQPEKKIRQVQPSKGFCAHFFDYEIITMIGFVV